ncbi:MAG TPA: hypothetical protein VGG48_01825 [Rhizomicrobium sp.]|jgi:hypothetical protein
MARLGSHVIYHTHDEHRTVTTKKQLGEEAVELQGSIHHPELTDFAGLVTRLSAGPSAGKKKPAQLHDIVIFPPGRAPTHVEGVSEGREAGEIEVIEN